MRTASIAICLASTALIATAGELNPPGAPAPTQAVVEPRIAINATNTPGDADSMFRISAPGSYYLTGQVSGEAAKSAIEIASNNVTLDLMGFELRGGPGTLRGITVDDSLPGPRSGIAVHNGTCTGWGISGFNLSVTVGAVLQDLRAQRNDGVGISCGSSGVVERCTAISNTNTGIVSGGNSIVRNCTSQSNGGGFLLFSSASATGCTANQNGFLGFEVTDNCTLVQCTASWNIDSGFSTGGNCVLMQCVASNNDARGFVTLGSGVIEGCTAQSNGGDGIAPGVHSSVTGCASTFNGGDGIELSTGCTATGNTTRSNGVTATDGVGIRLQGNNNVAEANTAGLNDYGIAAIGQANLIIRNRCHGSTIENYSVGINNYTGAVISRVGVSTISWEGNSMGSTLATTDPHANFSH